MKNNNIHSLPNAELTKAGIEKLKRLMLDLVEEFSIYAEMRKANYDAHIAQGFTAEQALVLCTKFGMD